MSRVYSQFLPKFLPGNPNIIVRNMPGGNATIGANYVYNSKPDGLTIMASSATVHLAYVTRLSAVKYDLQKMDAVVAVTTGNVYYLKPGIVDKAEDLPKTTEIVYGMTAGGGAGYIFIVTSELLGIQPKKVVLAYGGTADARRAYMAGELNMTTATTPEYWQTIDALVKDKQAQTVFQSGLVDEKGDIVKDPGLPPDIPTVKEVYQKVRGSAPSGTGWDAYKLLVASSYKYDKILLLPPGAPEGLKKVLWEAADKIVKDPEFRQKADALLGAGANWMSGESLGRDFKAQMVMGPEVFNWLKSALEKHGVILQ